MSDQELWQVKLSEGCVIDMTLDEIDTAFNAGRIQATTLVMPPGDMRWTTLGVAAGLEEEEAPYSIAPVAADIATPPSFGFGSPPVPDFDVDLHSFEEGSYGLPKKRNGGMIVGVVIAFVVLIGAGVGGGAYAARPNDVKAKIAAIKAKVSPGQPAKAAAIAPPPAAVDPPPVAKAPEPPPAPKPAEAAPAPATPGTSIDSLPDAKGKKGAKPVVTKKKK